MPGLYSHTTRGTGTVLTATIYNGDHENHITNATPQQHDDYSVSAAQMQSTVDPGEAGSESLATSLAGELERLRFAVKDLSDFVGFTKAQWYSTPTGTIPSAKLATVAIAQGGTGATTAGGARTSLGSGATGDSLFTSATADAARTTLGINPTAKGDLLGALAANTPAFITVGANGTIPMARSAVAAGIAYAAALNSTIYGLTYANNAIDPTNDIDISSGGAMDATNAYFMVGSALTKQSDVAWAVGNNAGGLDTGVVGNSDYYIWLIARSDTGVVDILFSLSSTAPTMPTNYDFKRRIGWFKRVGGTIVAFDTYEMEGGGLLFMWDSPTLDVDLLNTLTTSRRTDVIKVPTGFAVVAHCHIAFGDASGNTNYIYCPDSADVAPSLTVAPLFTHTGSGTSGGLFRIRTDSTGAIAARSTLATVDSYRVATLGFEWSRR